MQIWTSRAEAEFVKNWRMEVEITVTLATYTEETDL